ncbi:MAG: geranylgeranylglycerol-phosphate geranylgeranyltransferase [Bacteroidetes bacterium]|nr:geranylgeranylglycerol-phosphate geranylgeranyltransferase [Bacteroidota bacterium]
MIKYLKLARIGNVIIAFLSVECAGILCGINIAGSWEIFAAAIAASLITAGGNAVNDLFDVDIDKINRPHRPLASGMLSTGEAKVFYGVVTGVGLVMTAFINVPTFTIALGASVLVFLYSYKLKRTIFYGNLMVAFVTGLTFVYGGTAVGDLKDVYPAAIFAFLTNLIREIIKDAEDVEGDGHVGVQTIATKYGTAVSSRISIALTVVLLFMVWGAYHLGVLPVQFLTVCGLTVLPIGSYITYLLITRRSFSEASFGYKLMMIFGLAALIVGKV